jgi:glutathione peroxidase
MSKPYLEAVRILAAAAWADGSIGDSEAELVKQMIEVGPLSADDKKTAGSWLHSRVHADDSTLKTLSVERRQDIFKSAVRIAAADGRTVRAERGFLDRLRATLKLGEDDAKAIIEAVRAESKANEGAFAKLFRLPMHTIQHELTSLKPYKGKALLIVNVASECGFTPQYAGLQQLHQEYADRGLVVLGFPCNQFGGQEPGTAEEIEAFCTSKFGVTFPMMDKIDVKGDDQHDLYALLSQVPDADGKAGEVEWNFEKFVVSADANTVVRFRSKTEPNDPALIDAIAKALP